MYCLNCGHQSLSEQDCSHCGVYLPTLLRDLLPAQTPLKAGQYTLGAAIGRGGFGVTYQAKDASGQAVAIKEFFPAELAFRTPDKGLRPYPQLALRFERGIARFVSEAQILQRLQHPHIVNCLDLFRENNTAYFVMPLLQGQSLARWMESALPCSPETVEHLITPVVLALHQAHQAGIYHLDIKPDNIWLETSGNVLVLDFGAARQGTYRNSTQAFSLAYAPPEIIGEHNTSVGPYSDIFEIGMLVYELLTGQKAPDVLKRLNQMQLPLPELSDPWRTRLEQALHLEPRQRPQQIQDWWSGTSRCRPAASRPKSEPACFSDAWGMRFVWVAPGRFYMGSPQTEAERHSDETLHRVELRPGFWLQTTPVTSRQWQALMGSSAAEAASERPVTEVSWHAVQAFIHKLNQHSSAAYSLPTEAQWEYACRAGARRAYAFGNRADQLGDYAWYQANSSQKQPVASQKPNIWGLYDMHGNVCEWCQDDYAPYGQQARINPEGSTGLHKVYRGGSYLHNAADCRSARRFGALADFQAPWLGFRLIRLPAADDSQVLV